MTTERRNPQDPMIEEQEAGQTQRLPGQQQNTPQQGGQRQGNQENENTERARDEHDEHDERGEAVAEADMESDFEAEDELDLAEGLEDDDNADDEASEAIGASTQRIEDRQTGYRSGQSSGPN
ncbi:MAG TPA: hypothetical protein VMR52_09610 [Dehalococcoidia bacterium]|nr:hypothetical protein [Dehalococcoidia bacterium]